MDSPSMRALFEGMEEMREELEELKATTVCVWPAGPGSYLKGRVNERKENTGALIHLMKEALIPGADTKIDRFEGSIPIKNKQDGSPDFECLFLNFASLESAVTFCGDPSFMPKLRCHEITVIISQMDGGKKSAPAEMTVHFCLKDDIQNTAKFATWEIGVKEDEFTRNMYYLNFAPECTLTTVDPMTESAIEAKATATSQPSRRSKRGAPGSSRGVERRSSGGSRSDRKCRDSRRNFDRETIGRG